MLSTSYIPNSSNDPSSIVPQTRTMSRMNKILHGSVWLMFLTMMVTLDSTSMPLNMKILYSSMELLLYAGLVYFNLYYLIPKYLNTKKPWYYIIALIVTALMFTFLRVVMTYGINSGNVIAQQHVIMSQPLIFTGFLMVGGFSTVGKITTDWVKYQRDRQELITQNMQTELRFLRTQINPHFLFNTLNNLYALTLKKSDNSPVIVLKLSEMMRYMLYECNGKTVSLRKELQYLQNYLDLEGLRFGEFVDIKFEVEGDVRDQEVAPFLFIPFFENSFKHGVNLVKDGFIHVHFLIEPTKVTFSINNSKPEKLPAKTMANSGGIGLANVKQRLNMIFPQGYELNIDPTPTAYNVEMQLDLTKMKIY